MLKRLKHWILSHKKRTLIFSILIVLTFIISLTYSFAANNPVKSITITSKNTNYENNESGSWQVIKSAEWLQKGKATVTLDVDTTAQTSYKNTDIIFVLDISGSMSGEKINRVKQDTKELLEKQLSTADNRAALITFDSNSNIISDLTNDKYTLINKIDQLRAGSATNYYQALVNVDTILQDYTKEEDREVIVLFLTDGYPNVDIPNQIAQYKYLKDLYPYITINGIQYEMGNTILTPIKQISDNQYMADMETLNNVLFDASIKTSDYDCFEIVDYVDNRYFDLESADNITVSAGEVKLEEENGTQKITWTIPSLNSGKDETATDETYFGPYERKNTTHNPTVICPNKNDAFTVSSELGNGDLTYPIATLTIDEVNMAGEAGGNSNYYLFTSNSWSSYWWTISPIFTYNFGASPSNYYIYYDAGAEYVSVNSTRNVRPAISLNHDIVVVNGTGTNSNPYEVDFP